MWRYFTAENTHKRTKVLQEAVMSYNNSVHGSIGWKPADVTQADVGNIRDIQQTRKPSLGKADIHVGDKCVVHISKVKNVFAKAYLPNWTDVIFTGSSINRKHHPIVHTLKDYDNEVNDDSFYRHKIEPLIHKEDVYLMEHYSYRTSGTGKLMWQVARLSLIHEQLGAKHDISDVIHRR